MPLKHLDLGGNCSGFSLSTWTCLLTRGPGPGCSGPTAHPPASHTHITLAYFITGGPFIIGLGSDHPLYCLLKEVSEC